MTSRLGTGKFVTSFYSVGTEPEGARALPIFGLKRLLANKKIYIED